MQSYTFENCAVQVKVSPDGLLDHTEDPLNRISIFQQPRLRGRWIPQYPGTKSQH